MSSRWSNSVLVAIVLSLLLTVLSEGDASFLPREELFFRSQFKDFGKTLILGDNSEEDNNIVDIPHPFRFSVPRLTCPIIRLKPECVTKSQRFDPMTHTCYEIGTTGPCGSLMIFRENEYLHPKDKVYGHCECDRERYERPIVSVRGQCHFLYTKAICDPGHFLVMKFGKYGLEPVCSLNPCTEAQKHATTELIPYEGHCVKLNAPSILCTHKDDVVSIKKGNLKPTCASPDKSARRLFRRQITKTNELKCQAGYGKAKVGSTRCYRLLRISSSSR